MRKRNNFPFISKTSGVKQGFEFSFYIANKEVKIQKPVFLLYPKQEGIRAKTGFPFISETSGKMKNTLLQFKKLDDIVAATVWRMLK